MVFVFFISIVYRSRSIFIFHLNTSIFLLRLNLNVLVVVIFFVLLLLRIHSVSIKCTIKMYVCVWGSESNGTGYEIVRRRSLFVSVNSNNNNNNKRSANMRAHAQNITENKIQDANARRIRYFILFQCDFVFPLLLLRCCLLSFAFSFKVLAEYTLQTHALTSHVYNT